MLHELVKEKTLLTVESVSSLVWVNSDNTQFDCVVKFAQFVDPVPFGCNVNDPVAHNQEIWAKVIAGEYGEIAPFVPPQEPVADQPQPEVTGTQTL